MSNTPPPAGPGPRELYVLVVGVVAGILLGAGVLGRFSPDTYDQWFVGSGSTEALLKEAETKFAADVKAMAESGVTVAAIDEMKAQREQDIKALLVKREVSRLKTSQALAGRANALMAGVLAMMVLETLLAPGMSRLLARLTLARYALTAAWIALVLAQPALVLNTPVAFTGLLLVVTLAAALVPLPSLRKRETPAGGAS